MRLEPGCGQNFEVLPLSPMVPSALWKGLGESGIALGVAPSAGCAFALRRVKTVPTGLYNLGPVLSIIAPASCPVALSYYTDF